MAKERENSRTISIARQINREFWFRHFFSLLLLDGFLFVLTMIFVYVSKASGAAEGGFLSALSHLTEMSGNDFQAFFDSFMEMIRLPARILLGFELLLLISEMFHTGKVRQLMHPLTEMAIKMEELSSKPFGSDKMENFQQAISNFNPDLPGAEVKTGDKDLLPLEIAVNNLLERMRESHRQQERFVSDASHELRTPISVIQGYVNMLDRWGKEDEQVLEESIEAIKNESEHMKDLIEQLLFLARGDSGRNHLKFEDFDMGDMVNEVYEESSMIDEKHRYVFQRDGAVPARGDQAMIKQSLRIFVENAAKYSKEGDMITLRAKVIDGRPAYVVQDEGIGMASSEVVHVFERFYRAGGARNSAEGGTGLGLSIAKWIVDAHQGQVEVLSRPEIGTRFTVKF